MGSLYENGRYLETTKTWHTEDSAWKAGHILRLMRRNNLLPNTIVDVGCGAGQILKELAKDAPTGQSFYGFDISPQAIALATKASQPRIQFECADVLAGDTTYDLLLAIDVAEHVPDYLTFLRACKGKARVKIYHIPLELSVSALLRNTVGSARYSLGHIHYFNAEIILAALRDTGHEIIDTLFTSGRIDLFWNAPSVRRAIANLPRWLVAKLHPEIAARLFGGFSILVLTR